MFTFFFTLLIVIFALILLGYLISFLINAMLGFLDLLPHLVKIAGWILKIIFFLSFWPFILIWYLIKKCSDQQPQ